MRHESAVAELARFAIHPPAANDRFAGRHRKAAILMLFVGSELLVLASALWAAAAA